MQETMVIANTNITQGYGLQDKNQPVTRYSYGMITPVFLLNPIPMGRHEFAHQFANFADGYPADPGSRPIINPGYYINCQTEEGINRLWRNIPGFTGARYPGCGATERMSNGRDKFFDFAQSYKDSPDGIMSSRLAKPPYRFGPIEQVVIQRAIDEGLSRYRH
jgi:hypothetical protein